MKKPIKKIGLGIGKILMFFDKILINPIMKLVIKIRNLLSGNNKGFDKLFSTKQALLIISLIIAGVAFYFVDSSQNLVVNQQAEVLYGQPVKAIYNSEAYVIEGLPETVDVIMIGSRSHIYLAKQQPSSEISVDLRDLKPGTHKVSLKYRQTISSIDYKIDPSTVTVVVYDKVSSNREVTYEILHRDNLNSELDISNVELNKSEVTIKGSEQALNKVSYVKALIDVDNLVNPEVGQMNLNGVSLVAYDNDGEKVNVEILPETLSATLTIVSSSKEVPINIVTEGELATGYAIEELTSSTNLVTIYGSQEALDKINSVPVKVDVTNINSNKEFTVNIEKPTGVRELSVKTVTVKLRLGQVSQKEVDGVQVQVTNIQSNLNVKAVSQSDSQVSVIVKGTKEALEKLDTNSIIASVDLSDYTKAGEYEVEVKVTGEDNRLSFTSKTKKVKIKLTEK